MKNWAAELNRLTYWLVLLFVSGTYAYVAKSAQFIPVFPLLGIAAGGWLYLYTRACFWYEINSMTLNATEKKINQRIGMPTLIQSSTEFMNLEKILDVFRVVRVPQFIACFAVIYFGALFSDLRRSVRCSGAILWLSVVMWLIAGSLFLIVIRGLRKAAPEVYGSGMTVDRL